MIPAARPPTMAPPGPHPRPCHRTGIACAPLSAVTALVGTGKFAATEGIVAPVTMAAAKALAPITLAIVAIVPVLETWIVLQVGCRPCSNKSGELQLVPRQSPARKTAADPA